MKIYVAGHRGMAGRAIVEELESKGLHEIITRTHEELDLLDQRAVDEFFKSASPEGVVLAAAKVGGIGANKDDLYGFLYENLAIQNNVMNCCLKYAVSSLVFLGSSCIYPKNCPQPMKEEYLLTGPLEPTNEGYALAKISGIRMAQYLSKEHGIKTLSVMPCNLYGKGDRFDPENSHVLSALVKKFMDGKASGAPSVTLWGTGEARREFLNVKDMARCVVMLMEKWDSPEIVNVGSGKDISIKDLANKIKDIAGYRGRILWDPSMPDGMALKLMDVTKIKSLGFEPEISLDQGIVQMIEEYENHKRSFENV